jgi:Retroviral aspartyl protease/Zinc knuckle
LANLGVDRLDGLSKKSKVKTHRKTNKRDKDALRPLEQVKAKSYLGRVLDAARKSSRSIEADGSSSSSSSLSSSSTSDSPSSSDGDSSDSSSLSGSDSSGLDTESDSDSDSTSGSRSRSRNRSRSKKCSKQKFRTSSLKIKPRSPREYSGQADPKLFHQFVQESMDYVQDGHVPAKRQIRVLSYFLKGKARNYYVQKAARKEQKMSLVKFFSGIFDYCFPLSFRSDLREKLDYCTQGNKTISDYVYEIEELHMMIGISDKRQRVLNLWKGLHQDIRQALRWEKLNPEVSSWKKIVEAAKHYEVSKGEGTSKKGRSGNDYSQPNSNIPSHSSGHGRRDRNKSRSFNKERSNNNNSGNRNGSSSLPHKWGSAHTNNVPSGSNNARPRYTNHANNKPSGSNYRDSKPSRPQLSEKEKSELLAAGKCFKCKEVGHLARNCPQGSFVKSDKSGKAPGLPTYRIGLELNQIKEIDKLRELAESTEELHDLPVGAVFMEESCFACTSSHEFVSCPTNVLDEQDAPSGAFDLEDDQLLDSLTEWLVTMEDAPALVAEQLLQTGQPYPGDSDPPFTDEPRFMLVCIPEQKDWYLINDLMLDGSDDPVHYWIEVNKSQLLDPMFNIPQYYADRLADCSEWGNKAYPQKYNFQMGDAYLYVLACRLRYGACKLPEAVSDYDEYEAHSRFHFEKRDETYYIVDYGENMLTEISKQLLEQPRFEILPWYRKRIIECRKARAIKPPTYLAHAEDRVPMPIGDILAVSAEELLMRAEPYPGDRSFQRRNQRRLHAARRFSLTRVSEDHYMIQDSFRGTEAFILTEHLRTPEFLLAKWYAEECRQQDMTSVPKLPDRFYQLENGDSLADAAVALLQVGGPYPGDENHFILSKRFEVVPDPKNWKCCRVLDYMRNLETQLPRCLLENHEFDIYQWYDNQLMKPHVMETRAKNDALPNEDDYFFILYEPLEDPETAYAINELYHNIVTVIQSQVHIPSSQLELNGVQIPRDQLPAIEQNAAVTRDATRVVPKPIIVVARIHGQSVGALVDSGSLGDFMSTTLADQLRVKRINLVKPLPLQLAVQGSRSKVNAGTKVQFQYQEINEERYFDIINISNYDLILGTPWLYQHQVTISLNPTTVVVRSKESQPLRGESVTRIASRAMDTYNERVVEVREALYSYADPICVENIDHDLPLPPLRAINHTIPLIDAKRVYLWRLL